MKTIQERQQMAQVAAMNLIPLADLVGRNARVLDDNEVLSSIAEWFECRDAGWYQSRPPITPGQLKDAIEGLEKGLAILRKLKQIPDPWRKASLSS